MEQAILRGLNDKFYEKRKAAALDLEKLVRECQSQGDRHRINMIIDQLVELFATPSNALHARNGGLIGLAATAIALGVDISQYMEKFMDPLIKCFTDSESRIRYFACESMYNIAKVSKGEILVYFNPIFDSLSRLAADSEISVKNGAELLDRLLKDIVAESAPIYFPHYPEAEKIRQQTKSGEPYSLGILVPQSEDGIVDEYAKKAFSLAHFIPLLSERIYVVSPLTRSYLVAWISALDSVPDLELVSYLPDFLDGLLKYLSDPTEDVKVATENLLADFLREIREIAKVQQQRDEAIRVSKWKQQQQQQQALYRQGSKGTLDNDVDGGKEKSITEKGAFIPEGDEKESMLDGESIVLREGIGGVGEEGHDRDTGAWVPGQAVVVDHAAIVEILIQQLDPSHDEIQQSTALRWIAEFLDFVQPVMVPFTPRLIPAILPNLAHHVPAMQSAAIQTNQNLFGVIQSLPMLTSNQSSQPPAQPSTPVLPARTLTTAASSSSLQTMQSIPAAPGQTSGPARTQSAGESADTGPTPIPMRQNSLTVSTLAENFGKHRAVAHTQPPPLPEPVPPYTESASSQSSRPHSPSQSFGPNGVPALTPIIPPASPVVTSAAPYEEADPFDYQATVNMLTVQFLSEHEETRVAALKWLIMLHQKAPKKILAMDDGTFPALLKTLSDTSEEVIKYDLQLLAQISSNSEEGYFRSFMMNLLELFSTDRRLLDIRGSLIIRQLCLSLNTERIYRTFAEILEREEDLEFASIMVQKLNIILITSPELSELRKRLKNLESRDGQTLFSILYKSWCHNPVATFSLCLLAQAYEHGSNLLHIFADMEITVTFLVQIDKLVQLIESPVFTSLRLQLLEPEKYPYLFKCLYGLLMLLPQSSAFISLRNRLNAVSSMGSLHIQQRPTATISSRSKLGREEIKWQELLTHFRSLQSKHEKSRRQSLFGEGALVSFSAGGGAGSQGSIASASAPSTASGRPQLRRKVTENIAPGSRAGALSPLNPRARTPSGMNGISGGSAPAPGQLMRPQSPTRQRRALGVAKK
ncbi:hypothetical protein BOTBODRAFT_31687 [Botryobasidium botryosum FD-172 SS1]|uniref:Vacuolar protein 14 C-terminal Fig4-binding domain-containing protein n=1 Tax=Botryobasidium botryosum (strain FD-172 SS1) TaxID=930990 RepID=A0A067MHY7_BOTB1|nr:hypothetical protein BOTBODRAFT_31687 [Botryobasidium botryosum FD-172 SS1]